MAILLAPDVDSVSAVLAQNFGVATALTAWSNALLNTSLYPLDPKPSWYDTLTAQLQTAAAPARSWVETDGPAILAEIPQGFIDFGNLFGAAAPDVEQTMTAVSAASHHAATPAQTAVLTQTVATLLQQAQTSLATATSWQSTAKKFADTVRSQHATLTTTIAGAEATVTADAKQIADLRSTIASLQNALGIDSTTAANAAMSAYTSGLSLFGTLFLFSLTTLATGGATLPLVAVAVATVTVSANGARNASADSSVQSDLEALGAAQAKLGAEETQVAALRSILTTLQNLLDCNSAVANAADIIVPVWNDIVTRLAFLAEVLAQPVVDLTLVSALTTFNESASKWSSIVANATNVQASTLSMTETINLTSGATA